MSTPPVREASTNPSAATVLPAPVACSNQNRRAAPGSSIASAGAVSSSDPLSLVAASGSQSSGSSSSGSASSAAVPSVSGPGAPLEAALSGAAAAGGAALAPFGDGPSVTSSA